MAILDMQMPQNGKYRFKMFLSQNFSLKNKFSLYLVGSLVVILFNFIGQFPLLVAFEEYGANKMHSGSGMEMLNVIPANLRLFLVLLPFVFSFLGFWLVVRKLHSQTLLSVTTARASIDFKRILFSFLLWGGITVVFLALDYLANPQDYQWNYNPALFWGTVAIGMVMIPIQTSVEEYLFRGYLMQGFARMFRNTLMPLLFTSLIFGSLHIFNPEIEKLGYLVLIYYIGTGLFLGLITIYDQGIELALGFHAANNLFTALLVTSNWTAFQTNSLLIDISEPQLDFEIFVPLLIFFPLLFIIFSKKYQWNRSFKTLLEPVHENTSL